MRVFITTASGRIGSALVPESLGWQASHPGRLDDLVTRRAVARGAA